MVFKLDDELWFPDPSLADEDGCLAVGGDLSIDRLLLAYQNGIFPWFSFRDNDEPVWYCPKRRFVIFPKEIHISHSMRTLLRKDLYQFSVNMAFEDVIRNWAIDRTFTPEMGDIERDQKLNGWHRAVKCAFGWAREDL